MLQMSSGRINDPTTLSPVEIVEALSLIHI